jgi:polar amino acid transport system substrate-binding protein
MQKLLRAAAAAGLVVVLVVPARADTLDEVRQRGALRWGADQEGGGPYVYPVPDDPRRVTGFEVDLMDLLAKRMGVRSEFRQCEWTNLPDLLRTREIDAIVNGYELTEDRLATMIATIPYYIYQMQLIARRDDRSINSWDDLKAPVAGRKRKVGVLGPAAATYVRERLGDAVEVVLYQGTTDALLEVQNEKLDATVQDLPPALFYQQRYPALHFVGPPVGRGYYVIYLRPGAERLRDELNAGLLDLIHTGQLRALYERYGIWNPTQDELGTPGLGSLKVERSTERHGWAVLARNWPLLRDAALMTVKLTFLAMPLAIVAGLLIALGRLYGPAPLRGLLACYVEVLRGTPLLLQLFTIFFVLPGVGIRIPAYWAAILGLAINYSAYEAEIYRAGLLAVPAGQMEAALALGMSRAVALRRIIIPQAVRLVIPPVTNDFIALFKDTSICSVITVVELTKQYSILANSTGAYLELAAVTACLYLLMSYPLSLLARRLEARLPRVAA